MSVTYRIEHASLTGYFNEYGYCCQLQRATEVIVSIEDVIKATMYLDDLIVLAPDVNTCNCAVWCNQRAVQLTWPPWSNGKPWAITWLGIGPQNMTITILRDKVDATIKLINKIIQKHNSSITKKQLKSILRKVLHVQPASIFDGRLPYEAW